MYINFSDVNASQRYHIMTQSIIPRPIAWVLTDSGSDNNPNYNLAPFSYFTPVSSNPALLMLSVGQKPDGVLKDTLKNIIDNKKMVIHIASEDHAELVTQTAATLEHGCSELQGTELTTTEFENFSLPRIAQCSIAYGCELFEIKELDGAPQTLIFVEVKQLYLAERLIENSTPDRLKIDAQKIRPLARLGGGEYAAISEPFTLQRPK